MEIDVDISYISYVNKCQPIFIGPFFRCAAMIKRRGYPFVPMELLHYPLSRLGVMTVLRLVAITLREYYFFNENHRWITDDDCEYRLSEARSTNKESTIRVQRENNELGWNLN